MKHNIGLDWTLTSIAISTFRKIMYNVNERCEKAAQDGSNYEYECF